MPTYLSRCAFTHFQLLLDLAIKKAVSFPWQKSYGTPGTRVRNSVRSKVERYLSEKFDFRLNMVTQQCEILVKSSIYISFFF